MDGEKNSAAFQAFYRINLTNGEIRMFFCIGLETGKITPFTAGLVHLEISGNIFLGRIRTVRGMSRFLAVKSPLFT